MASPSNLTMSSAPAPRPLEPSPRSVSPESRRRIGGAWKRAMRASIVAAIASIGLLAAFAPVQAQVWTRVTQLPVTDVFSLSIQGDTLVAGVDTCAFVSTDAGASWHATSRVTPTPAILFATRVHDGRLYAGTASQGVFVSNDLGVTWAPFNEGLVGGFLDSQLHIAALEVQGNTLYAATLGAGVYSRSLVAGATWHHFGEIFEPNQASNVNFIASDGTQLLAAAGGNGTVFDRDPGDPEWTLSFLDNAGLEPGIQAQTVAWNGNGWVVGTLAGVFRSATGEQPWAFSSPGLGVIRWTAFATRGSRLFAAFDLTNDVSISTSGDDGASWSELERIAFRFVYAMVTSGNDLFAARKDGLWRRSLGTLSVPDRAPALKFDLAGAQPSRDLVRFRVDTPEAAAATIEVFDVTGRSVGEPLRFFHSAGSHVLTWDARALAPGVYESRLTVGSHRQTLRVVHIR